MGLKGKKAKQYLNPLEREKLAAWENGVEDLMVRVNSISEDAKMILSERPLAVLKVGVYKLVNDLHGGRKNSRLEGVLATLIGKPLKVRFEDNPYHWGFAAISAEETSDLRFHRSISELSRELLYARRHGIPEELLIGFIAQAGGARRILERVDQNVYEDWWHRDLPWLPHRF